LTQECRQDELSLPLPEVARAKLRARLDEASSREEGRLARRIRQWRPIGAAAGIVILVMLFGLDRDRPEQVASTKTGGVVLARPALPRPDLTPGAVRQVSVEEVCEPEKQTSRPRVDVMTAQQVFEHYGADFRRAKEYELDFLITPELGGTADIRNLWPQPYASTTWNAYVKDELEQLFRQRVCAGTMDISTAQREIANDWISAYRRYFDTERPRRIDTRRDG
jgi:hypothetical protein